MAKHYVHTSDDQTDTAIRRMEQSLVEESKGKAEFWWYKFGTKTKSPSAS
jgi:hypothetical protein